MQAHPPARRRARPRGDGSGEKRMAHRAHLDEVSVDNTGSEVDGHLVPSGVQGRSPRELLSAGTAVNSEIGSESLPLPKRPHERGVDRASHRQRARSCVFAFRRDLCRVYILLGGSRNSTRQLEKCVRSRTHRDNVYLPPRERALRAPRGGDCHAPACPLCQTSQIYYHPPSRRLTRTSEATSRLA